MNTSTQESRRCVLCGSSITALAVPLNFRGITSDCKPWPRLGNLFVCDSCGHVQKVPEDDWRSDVARIQSDYEIYHLSGGTEQLVFTRAGCRARSVELLEHVSGRLEIPKQGRLLDFGCGNGALLQAFGKLFPGWEMVGADTNPVFRDPVLKIPGVVQFFPGDLEWGDVPFDFIAMVHVMEHIPNPPLLLDRISRKLTPGGLVLIQVPDLSQNPFDLVVVDHCSHFVPETLLSLVHKAGNSQFAVEILTNEWIPREVTIILRKTSSAEPVGLQRFVPSQLVDQAKCGLAWLTALVEHARGIASRGDFAIFGTGIGASWLAGMLEDMVDFFVDEDPSRWGKTHLGKPVLPPRTVKAGSRLYLTFPTIIAADLKERLQKSFPSLALVMPPDPSVGIP